MTPIDGYSLDLPGMSRYFALPGVDDLEGQASIEPMCRAFAALGPLVRPLSIDSLLHAFRRDEQDAVALPRPFALPPFRLHFHWAIRARASHDVLVDLDA